MFAMRAERRLSFPSIRPRGTNNRSSKTVLFVAALMSYKFRSILMALCELGRKPNEVNPPAGASVRRPLAGGWVTAAAIVVCLLFSQAVQAEPLARYQAVLQNGQRVQGKSLSDWHEPHRVPRIDSQAILEPGNPARWLRDRTHPLPDTPPVFIEMHTGDCLPALVLEARSGLESKFDPLPAHVIAEPRITLEPPKDRPVRRVRVDVSYIRRIVWQRRRKLEYQPGTLFYRDGRMLQFQAFRMEGTTVQILLDDGARRVPFNEISELHLPAVAQPWQLHYSELAVLCTKPETRLWQLETSGGLVVTSSPERFVPRFEGNPKDPVRWVHGLQPAWSLEPLWIPVRDVAAWRFFAQNEVPLQRAFELHRGERSATHWETNRNILGGPLRSLKTDFGFGLGVQAPGELTLPLPSGCQAIRMHVCLDRVAGPGGCARVRLRTSAGAPPLWESPLLVGSETVADTGRFLLPAATGANPASELHIELDQVHEGRPSGADPLNIRDHINLADGWLELDPKVVQQELELRLPERFAAWKGWQVTPTKSLNLSNRELKIEQERRLPDRGEEGFVPNITVQERPLVLNRELTLQPEDQWLVIAAARVSSRGTPGKIDVRIDGAPAAEFEVPELRGNIDDTPPLLVSLAPYQRGRARSSPPTIQVEVRQHPGNSDASPIRWRSIFTTTRPPNICEVYEDQPQVKAESTNQAGAKYVTAHRFSGRGSLQLPGPDSSSGTPSVYRIEVPTPLAIRERPQWGEYRFVRFAVFRPPMQQHKGRLSLEFEPVVPGRRPFRIDTGKGKPAFEAARRVWDGDLPGQWLVITRDLFADFGEFDLRGLLVSCFEGEELYFDYVYLGRSPGDLDHLPPRPSSWEDATTALNKWPADIEKRLRRAIVGVEFPDGRWTGGVIFKGEGEVLVPGHTLGNVNESVTVHCYDGATYPAKTKGICRDRDLGMVKLDSNQQLSAIPFWDVKEPRLADDYVAMLLPAKLTEPFPLPAVQVEVQQAVRGRLWSTLDKPESMIGGVLCHRHGYLMGIHVGRHPLGGLIFERPNHGDLPDPIGRMRSGEIFGSWPLGSEPLVGFTMKRRPGAGKTSFEPGLVVDKIESPQVAAAGLKEGDIVLACEGIALFTSSDLAQAIEQKQPEEEVTLDVERAGERLPVKIKLMRRKD
jgi:hypothetical protein